jgi:hypothetical protein
MWVARLGVVLALLLMVAMGGTRPVAAEPEREPGSAGDGAELGSVGGALNPEFMGMVVRDPWFDFDTNPALPGQPNRAFQDRMGATLAQAGVRWVRLDFRIAAGREVPAEDPLVQSEIAKNDYFINEVAPRHGFRVLGLLSFDLLQGTDANLLNTGPFTETTKYGGGVNVYMRSWLDRALAVADRYGARVAAYQVLNEQNRLPQYLPGGPSANAIAPEVVGRLVTKLFRFCRGMQPLPEGEPAHGCSAAQIVLGGLHPRGTDTPRMTDGEYLQAIYADPGSFLWFYQMYGFWPIDGIGYHPYPEEIRLSGQSAGLVEQGVARMRTALEAAGDPCRPLWVSEIGYNVGFDVDGPANPIPQQTEAGQAAFMRDVYTLLAARQVCGNQPEVARVFWFKYEDFPPESGPQAQRWGIARVPFRVPQPGENCPGGACYELSGTPEVLRLSYYTYRELAGLPVTRIALPLITQ